MTNYDMTNQIEVISISSTGASFLKIFTWKPI